MSRWRWIVAFAAVAACAAPAPRPVPGSFLTSAAFRRSALEASIVNPQNDYSRLRAKHYARDWDELPEWNPKIDGASPLFISEAARAGSTEALRALGEQAFSRYPVQLMPSLEIAIRSRESAERYGVRAIVRAKGTLAVTCATCHSRDDVVGVANGRLDLGRMFNDANREDPTSPHVQRLREWGPGRMDVTTTRGDEPVRIPDLRPIRFVSHLHQDATLKQVDVTSLAIRIETLVIVSNGMTFRPPREVALGLALYLWSLGDTLMERAPTTESEVRGQSTFGAQCTKCHAPPAFSGAPVALSEVGTDAVVGLSHDRGTGFYRVPSLRGVGTRGALLHDGSMPSLDAMFAPSPARSARGHVVGLDLDDGTRADLVAYLRTL